MSRFNINIRRSSNGGFNLIGCRGRRRRILGVLSHWINMMALVNWYFVNVIMKKSLTSYRPKMRSYTLDFFAKRDKIRAFVHGDEQTCIDELRMSKFAFFKLCEILEKKGGLKNTKNLLIDEQVAIFLFILSHHIKNRTCSDTFQRSGETVSRYFNKVLTSVIKVQHLLFKKSEPIPSDSTDNKWKWFKNCLGALDGTHIKVRVPIEDKPRYRTRKNEIATNVLAACTPDMQFTYVLPGWEGSAADGRVLRDALSRKNGLKVPTGCYYLVDAGFPHSEGFVAPFRGQRYHLNEWRGGNQPTTPEELFNRRHSSARNVVERIFGLLKMRWAILRSPSYYPIRTQNRIILACCLLHNYIRKEMGYDPLECDNEASSSGETEDDTNDTLVSGIEPTNEWTMWRQQLANEMFDEWRASR